MFRIQQVIFGALLVIFSLNTLAEEQESNIIDPGTFDVVPEQQEGQEQRIIQRVIRQYEEMANGSKKQKERDESESGVTLQQQYNGHYFVNGSINNIPLVFAIDTGASFVSLPKQVAEKAGIACEKDARMETANGIANGCMGIISMFKFGNFSIRDVPCMIMPNLNQALLGNNILTRFQIHQQNGEMRITK